MVLGDGSTIHYRVQLGEVLRLRAPEQLLDRLRAEHWIGIEVTEA